MQLGTRLVLILLLVLVIGCAAPAATPTRVPPTQPPQATEPPPTQPPQPTEVPPTEAPPTAVPTDTPAPSGGTVAELANLGRSAYSASCSCHGDSGQGSVTGGVIWPALVGADSRVSGYGNAQALLDRMVGTMPRASPGSLSADEYLQILAWLLLSNGYVQPTDVLEEAQLSQIPLAK